MLSRIENGKELVEKLKNNKKNIIFGAGYNGTFLNVILKKFNIDIEYYLVNDGHRKEEEILGVNVFELSEVEIDISKSNIIYSLESNSIDIAEKLLEKANDSIIAINSKTLISLLDIFFLEYFEKNQIDISNEIIEFSELKTINPFLLDKSYAGAFLYELGDLILPYEFNDYTLINEGLYECGNVKLEKDDVVIDCGANIGIFSAMSALRGCKVFAFEPIPDTVTYLKQMAQMYEDKIEVCEYALSNECGIARFNIREDDTLSSSMIKDLETDTGIEVNLITLDEYVKINKLDKVDFIKADIEGAERFMLQGAKETLKRFAPKIAICTYHLSDDKETLERIIKEANPNYIVEHKWKKLFAYVPK